MTRVVWKEEGDGVGPVFVYENDEEVGRPRPFNPDREPPKWVTLAEAEAVASEHEVELETS
jgi:hypothetical protein